MQAKEVAILLKFLHCIESIESTINLVELPTLDETFFTEVSNKLLYSSDSAPDTFFASDLRFFQGELSSRVLSTRN